MTRKVTTASILLLYIITMSGVGLGSGYAIDIMPAEDKSTMIVWEVLQTPTAPVESYWTGGGYWTAQAHSNMSFVVGDTNEDVVGWLTLGNMTILANDTMISRDLTLGVWGIVEFSPGLFIKIDSTSIDELNSTAFDAVERVKWNYLNGTMVSYYDNYTINDVEYECIFFEYRQDPTLFGIPQHTQLVYSLSTGVLLYANTSYDFGTPYNPYHLEIKFKSIDYHGTMPNLMFLYAIVFFVVIVVLVIMAQKQRKN